MAIFSLPFGVLFWQRCPEPRIGDFAHWSALVRIGLHWSALVCIGRH